MKNYILVLFFSFLFLSCDKDFQNSYFPNTYDFLSRNKITEEELVSSNQKLLDSLLNHLDSLSFKILYCHNDDFLKKIKIDNKIQKQELGYWQACMDSIYQNIHDRKLIHYLYLAHKVKPITKKDLKKRAEVFELKENKKFDLAIFFSEDSIYDCYAEYLQSINLIVIYDYKNTKIYGEKDKYLSRALLFFHELFHADEISQKTLEVVKQHILINFYEKEIVKAQPQMRNYIEELLTYNLDFLLNQIFIKETYINHGELAIMILQNYSHDCFYKKAINASVVKKISSQNTNPFKE